MELKIIWYYTYTSLILDFSTNFLKLIVYHNNKRVYKLIQLKIKCLI